MDLNGNFCNAVILVSCSILQQGDHAVFRQLQADLKALEAWKVNVVCSLTRPSVMCYQLTNVYLIDSLTSINCVAPC